MRRRDFLRKALALGVLAPLGPLLLSKPAAAPITVSTLGPGPDTSDWPNYPREGAECPCQFCERDLKAAALEYEAEAQRLYTQALGQARAQRRETDAAHLLFNVVE